jgi:leucyl aminopeptidase
MDNRRFGTLSENPVEFSIKSLAPEKHPAQCVAVGIYEGGKLAHSAQALDAASRGYLRNLIRNGDFNGALGSTLVLFQVPGVAAARVVLVGVGKESGLAERAYLTATRAMLKAVSDTGAKDALLCLAEIPVGSHDMAWKLRQVPILAHDTVYRFDELKSKKSKTHTPLRQLVLNVARVSVTPRAGEAVKQGDAIGQGMNLTKTLGNLPGNICTPTYLADQARALAKSHKMSVKVLEQKDMEKLGMGSLLSVAKGSRQPPKLIVLEYHGGPAKQKPVVLVGKGITFDSGGISLKPGAEMDEMKFDMCGAASVLGTLKACAAMGLRHNVVGVIPTCENMPDGAASKPGDIVTSMSGQTIEILNTDAEGRLILCDALTYAERFDPAVVIDIATLTGAIIIALGHLVSGLFSNKDALAAEILDAGQVSFDRAWQLPLHEEYQDGLKSNFADMANIGGRPGGSITAASFLARYARKYDWAHLDIAGTAWKSGKEKGATGRPVPLLTQFLMRRAGKSK